MSRNTAVFVLFLISFKMFAQDHSHQKVPNEDQFLRFRSAGLGIGIINDNGLVDGDDYGNTLGFESWFDIEFVSKANRSIRFRYMNSNSLYTRQELGITHITDKGTKRFYDGTPNASGTWYQLTWEVESDLWDKYKDQAKEGRSYVSFNNQTPISVYRNVVSANTFLNDLIFVEANLGTVRLDHGNKQVLTTLQSNYHYWTGRNNFNNEEYVRTVPGLEENATYLITKIAAGMALRKHFFDGICSAYAAPSVFAQKNIPINGSSKNYSSYQLGGAMNVVLGMIRNKNHEYSNLVELALAANYDPYEAFPVFYDAGAMGSLSFDFKLNFFSKTISTKGKKRALQVSSFIIPFGIALPYGEGKINNLKPYENATEQSETPEFTNKILYAGIAISPLGKNE